MKQTLDGRKFAGVVLECGKTGRCRHADLQGRALPFERVRPLRLRRRRLHRDAVRRESRSRPRPKARSTASCSGRASCAGRASTAR